MLTITDFIRKNQELGKVLYYPGAGGDFSPIRIFGPHSSIETIIFTDYSTEKFYENLRKENICIIKSEKRLFPYDFGKRIWDEFWPVPTAVNDVYSFGSPANAYGIKMSLFFEETQKDLTFYYLGTDGIQTYNILCDNNLTPDILVLQEHGAGGNWSYFGYQKGNVEKTTLYDLAKNHPPKYILVEPQSNTEIWPGYEQITYKEFVQGPMHNNERGLYQKK
jgi:hypothetical protein